MSFLHKNWKVFFVYNPSICLILSFSQIHSKEFFPSLAYSNLMALLTSFPVIGLMEYFASKNKFFFLRKNFILANFFLSLPFLFISFFLVNYLFSFFSYDTPHLDASMYLNGILFLLITLIFLSFIHDYVNFKNKSLLNELENIKLKNENLLKNVKLLNQNMNPHFLFNALNSLASIISEDTKKAEQMTLKLSELYRGVFLSLKEDFHSLKKELTLCEDYLSIEKVRFEDRFKYHFVINISEEEMDKISIPTMSLQPLFENVIKHGVMNNLNTTELDFFVEKKNDQLNLRITNNISSLHLSNGSESSLELLKERFKLLYEGRAQLNIQKSVDRFTVDITVPIITGKPIHYV